jgi:hypothetical protein
VYQRPVGVKSEDEIWNYFLNYMKSVKNHSNKTTIYNYILQKATEALQETPTDKSNDKIYQQFHTIMDDIQGHTSPILIKRIYRNIKAETDEALKLSGGKRTATTATTASVAPTAPSYKLNGEKVHLLINKKKLHRSVYVKDKGNGKAKYCKINNEFVLLSKLKNKII